MAHRRKCSNCQKPLGSTLAKCHECGGDSYRGGDPISPEWWLIDLGVETKWINEALKDFNKEYPK